MPEFSCTFVSYNIYEIPGKQKYDSITLGTVLGLLAPMVVFMVYYLVRYRGMSLPSFIHYLTGGGIFLPILSLCVTVNLLIFFIFIWTKRDKSARGVLQATFIYAIYVCIMKLT